MDICTVISAYPRSRLLTRPSQSSGRDPDTTRSIQAICGRVRYLLVDGNPTGMEHARTLLQNHFPDYHGYQFVLSRIQDFSSDERFDVVFCEGVIPHQKDPASFTRHVGSFVRPGGVLGVTTADYVSVFPEVLRRVVCDTIVRNDEPLAEKVTKLVPVFASHYASLPGASRPIEDWLIDTLLDTWGNPLFSFPDAVAALSSEFEVYGSSPKFMTDWRWYKDLNASTALINERAIEEYHSNSLSLMDCRGVCPPQSRDVAGTTSKLCEDAFWAMIKIRNSAEPDFSEVLAICDDIVRVTQATLPNIAMPVSGVLGYLRLYSRMDPTACFDTFRSFFGRGQQYVSFVRRSG